MILLRRALPVAFPRLPMAVFFPMPGRAVLLPMTMQYPRLLPGMAVTGYTGEHKRKKGGNGGQT